MADYTNLYTIMEYTFEAVQTLSLQNSFGTLREAEDVTLCVSVGVKKDGSSGWFEMYDKATGGADWYAEGGLWFDDKQLVDYDGVFSLPPCVCECLRNNGYDTSYID